MRTRKTSAGDIIEAVCTRCRSVLNHTIVAMVGEKVVRVECNTCHGVHNFRENVEKKASANGSSPRKTAAAPREPKKDSAAGDLAEWESISRQTDRSLAIPYNIAGTYRVNDLVGHPVFGLGVVKSVAGPNRMEVLFQSGRKLLRRG